jgi:hypothetical protein
MTIVMENMDWTHGMVFMTSSKRNDMMVNVTWLNQLSSQLHVSHIPREVTSIFSKCYEKKYLTQLINFFIFECK